MGEPLEIAVVGCGSAGPAAALFLHRAGHRVRVFERAPDLTWVGAGFMIQPTGLHVLSRLGLLDPIVEAGAHLTGLRCERVGGKRLMDLRYGEVEPDMFAIGLHRAVLMHFLEQALLAESIPLELGREISEVRDRSLVCDGEVVGPFDLIIAADGARSVIRKQLPVRGRADEYRWGALWHMTPNDSYADHLFQVVDGADRMVGALPTGKTVDGEHKLVSLFWSIHCDRVEAWRAAGLDAWKREVIGMMPYAEQLLDDVHDLEQITFARYWDVRMSRWHHGNVVVIGDAAHATSPQLGQGVNLALWDAMVLADSLEAAGSVPEALAAYQTARRRHLGYYQWATRFLTPFFQSDSRFLGGLRNFGMGVAMAIGPLRRQMVRTMAGMKRGLVRRSMPVPKGALVPTTTGRDSLRSRSAG